MKRKLKRLYRKYWNAALPFVLGYAGITPAQYQTGKKVWKSKPVRKTRTRTKKIVKKYLRYVFAVGLVYYFMKNPADLGIMIAHFLGVLAGAFADVFAFIVKIINFK